MTTRTGFAPSKLIDDMKLVEDLVEARAMSARPRWTFSMDHVRVDVHPNVDSKLVTDLECSGALVCWNDYVVNEWAVWFESLQVALMFAATVVECADEAREHDGHGMLRDISVFDAAVEHFFSVEVVS